MNFVQMRLANARLERSDRGIKEKAPIFLLTATQAGLTPAFKNGRFQPPDYRPMFEGIEAALQEHMLIHFMTSSKAAVHQLQRHYEREDKVWIVERLRTEQLYDRQSGASWERGVFSIMECWGL